VGLPKKQEAAQEECIKKVIFLFPKKREVIDRVRQIANLSTQHVAQDTSV